MTDIKKFERILSEVLEAQKEFKNFDGMEICDSCKAASFSKVVHKVDCENSK